ncbi:putative rRNA biogenesis protein rrp36 [Thermoascus aurantiacus ATCC 26904]
MGISDKLNRRLRARPEEDEDEDMYSETSASEEESDEEASESEDADSDMDEDEEEEEDEDDDADDMSEDDGEDGDEEEEESEEDEEDIQSSLNNISFGALAKAQASLGNIKKRPNKSSTTDSSQLDDIRARIREVRDQKRKESESSDSKSKDKKDKDKKDKEKGKEKEKKEKRSSKHAPAIQSTKHAVSRKRQVVSIPNAPKPRDPRFDPAVLARSGGGSTRRTSAAMNKAYAFLDEYRQNELKELKEQLARTKDPEQREQLERQVRSMTDRMRALEDKRREREILAAHKRRERQLLREGKKSKPWFLKKSDLKREVLIQKYESMGAKERAKALERRRKKIAAKERKEMPWGRRSLLEGDAGGSGSGSASATAGSGKKRKRGGQ